MWHVMHTRDLIFYVDSCSGHHRTPSKAGVRHFGIMYMGCGNFISCQHQYHTPTWHGTWDAQFLSISYTSIGWWHHYWVHNSASMNSCMKYVGCGNSASCQHHGHTHTQHETCTMYWISIACECI
jgi:hypothetical protein